MKLFLSRLVLGLWVGLLASCSTPASDTPPSTVRIRWDRDPENLDPLVVSNKSAYEVSTLTYCSLLSGSEADADFVPWLAEDFPTVERTADSLLLVSYRLRPEARWDNGTPILARDVAFTLKVMNCPGLPIEMDQAMFGFIQDIRLDSTDARRFTLVCSGPSPDHIRESGDFSIFPEYVLDPRGELRTVQLADLRRMPAPAAATAFAGRYQALELAKHPERLPGCGPYKVTTWQNGRYLTMARKPHWWADTLPAPPPALQAFPDQLIYQIIPDAATATLALRRGEIDLYALMPAAEFTRLQQSAADREKLRFYTTNSYEFLAASFDVRQPVLRDARTRRALSALFNIPALIAGTQQGNATPSVGLISPRLKAYYNDSLSIPAFSPAAAADLLRQAGWQRQPDGTWQRPAAAGGPPQKLQLGLSYRAGEAAFETAALQFQAAARALGIGVDLRPTEQSVLSGQLHKGETDLSIRTFTGNPFSFDFTPLLHTRGIGAGNTTGFSEPASDQLIEQIAAANEPARKALLLRRFQRLLYQERPFTVLYFLRYRVAAAQRLGTVPVTGLKPGYEAAHIRPLAPKS
ncbi:hypothetical protein CDA63_12945 [Hymenobacter amundsenii]|uniref:Solute-binding protein family 5 domain-containing protein n=1 Tax=Hymenobacter amundsenii TaxID=2006685 RepID=A0A246FJC4_9BACT|nr:ABC transporter substrate-binding protein [Hymenobacter amundsenii]OWP62675.1 hypothetical protein CDA63_12945 [Hymenobacter amundsenii]